MALPCPATPPPATDQFIESLLNDLDFATLSFLCDNQTISPYLVTMWRAGAILVVLYIGFTFLFGGSSTFKDLVAQVAKIAFTLAVVKYMGIFSGIFYTLSTIWPNEMAGQFVTGGVSVDGTGGGVNGALSAYLENGLKLSGQIMDDAGFWKPFMIRIFSAVTALVTVIFTFAALLLITLAKLGTAIILAVGPFFVIGLMFEKTRGYFESWFKALMSFALIPIILYALMALMLSIVGTYYSAALGADTGAAGAAVRFIAPVIIISLIGIALITQVQQIAAQLAGGVAISTQAGLGWAGRQIQSSAGKGARRAASKAGSNARAGAGAIARSPLNYARGLNEKPAGYKKPAPTTALGKFAAKGAQLGGDFKSGLNRIRRDGAAYTAGRGTTTAIKAARRRSLSE